MIQFVCSSVVKYIGEDRNKVVRMVNFRVTSVEYVGGVSTSYFTYKILIRTTSSVAIYRYIHPGKDPKARKALILPFLCKHHFPGHVENKLVKCRSSEIGRIN